MKYMLIYGELWEPWMTDDTQWRVIGNLESDIRAIRDLLAEGNLQRREFQADIRTAVTEMQTYIPDITHSKDWIEKHGKRTVRRVDRAHWTFLGGVSVAGAVGSSPAWLTKVTAFFSAIFP